MHFDGGQRRRVQTVGLHPLFFPYSVICALVLRCLAAPQCTVETPWFCGPDEKFATENTTRHAFLLREERHEATNALRVTLVAPKNPWHITQVAGFFCFVRLFQEEIAVIRDKDTHARAHTRNCARAYTQYTDT